MTTVHDRYRQGQAPAVTRVVDAVARVNDPEYPDVSIVDLGLLETVDVVGGVAHVGLIPTFSGCPALHMIAGDVSAAVELLGEIDRCVVSWLPGPVWTTDRMTDRVRSRLAGEYTVVVRRPDGSLLCPVCGSAAVADQAMAGPTRCRSVAWCPDCRNPVEVMRVDVVAPPVAVPVTISPTTETPTTVTRTTETPTTVTPTNGATRAETPTTETPTNGVATANPTIRSVPTFDTMEVCA